MVEVGVTIAVLTYVITTVVAEPPANCTTEELVTEVITCVVVLAVVGLVLLNCTGGPNMTLTELEVFGDEELAALADTGLPIVVVHSFAGSSKWSEPLSQQLKDSRLPSQQ